MGRIPSGPLLVSRTGDVGSTKRRVKVPNCALIPDIQKVLVHSDSRTVAMEYDFMWPKVKEKKTLLVNFIQLSFYFNVG